MCGIGGIFRSRGGAPVLESDLSPVRNALRHRGPDDEGLALLGRLGICHTRLSVIDLSSRARQPMTSDSGRYVISYNGEVYNYRELRSELVLDGAEFRSDSDTEVILQLFERDGLVALQRLEGMFAFAIFDCQEEVLTLVRDRLGIKPLFWTQGDDGIGFASEPKALRGLHLAETPSPERLAEYLSFRHLAGEESLLSSVKTLAPGHYLQTDGSIPSVKRWWEPAMGNLNDAVEKVASAAVKKQMVSDVPVGIFLSGGVDSALVAGTAADQSPSIETFTVGFGEAGWDETDRSQVVAQALKLKNHVVRLDEAAFANGLRRAIWQLDAPLNHAHSVHLLSLSAFAKDRVTVVLTGEGGDELFGGYPRYRLFLASRYLNWLPDPISCRLAGQFADSRPRLSRLFDAAASGPVLAAAINSAFVPISCAAAMAGLADPTRALSTRSAIVESAMGQGSSGAEALLELDQQTYLVSLLQRMDRMSMSVGLECRVPLLDECMLALARATSVRDKLSLFETKRPLKRAAARRYGRDYAYAPKSGFGVPLDSWFRGKGSMGQLLGETLRGGLIRERGWLDADFAKRCWDEHRSGARDHTEMLWGVLNLELWAQQAIDGDRPTAS